jgi:dienelactone hydrolase
VATLDSWTLGEHRSPDGTAKPTYRKGSGPGVVVIHELPGITPRVVDFGDEVVASGFTVVLPVLFGKPGAPMAPGPLVRSIVQVCTNAEFTRLATGKTAPVTDWLRSLTRELHAELGGPGVGALGMCFTGGYALGMMVEDTVAAPVVAQPAAPFPIGRRRAADLGLSPSDQDAVVARATAGCQVLGIRYEGDRAVGTRFETLHRLLGEAFIAVDLPGKEHSTLTEHRSQVAVDRVLAFLHDKLDG